MNNECDSNSEPSVTVIGFDKIENGPNRSFTKKLRKMGGGHARRTDDRAALKDPLSVVTTKKLSRIRIRGLFRHILVLTICPIY